MTSLIITTYNYDRYVERSIRSALDQSLDQNDYEIIIVNDASTDRTEEVLRNYENDARIFNLPENIGLAAARNYGIKKAKGQFVMFLDADDFIHRDLLRVTRLFLAENVNLDAVAVDYWLVNERGLRQTQVDSKENPIACGILFRKDLLFEIGLYDEDFEAREEEDLRIRWEIKYQIQHLPIPLYRYRMHENNLTKNVDAMRQGKSQLAKKHS